MVQRKGEKVSAMDALVAYMKGHPQAVYADAQAALAKQGHKIFPIMWGRAQVMLGRVKAKKRGAKKAAVKTTAAVAPAPVPAGKRGPGRPRKVERPVAAAGNVIVGVDASELANWQRLVKHLNSGAKVALQYDGSSWNLVSA